MIFKKIALTSLVFVFSTSVFAQDEVTNDTGWYVGGYLGSQSSELKDYGTWKNTDTSFGVFGGYNFSPWFGLESSFLVNETDERNSGIRSAGFASGSLTPKFTLAINDQVALYFKAGFASIAYTEEYRNNGWYSDDDESWAGVGNTFGVGGEYRINNGLRLRLSYDQARATLEDVDDYYADKKVKLFQTGLSLYYQF
ncbi:MAG: porin family protein [Pseudomonadota bacterium]